MEDTSFDSFGDFGDFQAARGDLTPTPDSWSFTSGSTTSDEAGVEDPSPTDAGIDKGTRSGLDGS
jgi:hypothetical protein